MNIKGFTPITLIMPKNYWYGVSYEPHEPWETAMKTG